MAKIQIKSEKLTPFFLVIIYTSVPFKRDTSELSY